jgi:serine protease Do
MKTPKMILIEFTLLVVIMLGAACQLTVSEEDIVVATVVAHVLTGEAETAPKTTPQPPTAVPPTATTEPTLEPTPTATPEPTLTFSQVENLDQVQYAVFQVQSTGNFADPDYKYYRAFQGGSGFIFDSAGLGITSSHVVQGASEITIKIPALGKKTYSAEVIGVSECTDLALIDIEGEGFPHLTWNTESLQEDQPLVAAGYPLGQDKYRPVDGLYNGGKTKVWTPWYAVEEAIYHNAPISMGYCGGPLLIQDAQVAGVLLPSLLEEELVFALGSSQVQEKIAALEEGTHLDWLGINGMAVSFEKPGYYGLWITSLQPDSPADQANLQPGDLIYQINEQIVNPDTSKNGYCSIIQDRTLDSILPLHVIRISNGLFSLHYGQINGRPLLQIAFGKEGELPLEVTDPDQALAEAENPRIKDVVLHDNTDALAMVVPGHWQEIRSRIRQDSISVNDTVVNYQAAELKAAESLSDYNRYQGSGVRLLASRRWGELNTLDLLEGTHSWYQADCELMNVVQETNLDRFGIYQGSINYWECGEYSLSVHAFEPKSQPGAYLGLLEMIFPLELEELDYSIRDNLYDSYMVIGELPE